jgi:hypothetical protein
MDEVHIRSGGNNDRREVENPSEDEKGDEDEIVKGIIQRIQSRTGEDENEGVEQVNMFHEGDLDVGNLDVPENDPWRGKGGES